MILLLIVADAGAPTTGDALIKTSFENKGYTVNYKSASDAESIGSNDCVCISESVSSGVAAAKYSTLAVPALVMESLIFDDWLFCNTPGVDTVATVNINIDADPLAAGLLIAGNPHTVNTGGTIGVADTGFAIASGLVQVIDGAAGSITGMPCGGYIPNGGALITGNAPALRIMLGWTDSFLTNISTKGQQILDAAIDMITDELGGGGGGPSTGGAKGMGLMGVG